jgi:hypothetical protein
MKRLRSAVELISKQVGRKSCRSSMMMMMMTQGCDEDNMVLSKSWELPE